MAEADRTAGVGCLLATRKGQDDILTTPPPSIQSPRPEPCSLIVQERARDLMWRWLPSLVVPQILIRTTLLDTSHALLRQFLVGLAPSPSFFWLVCTPPNFTRSTEPTLSWNQLHSSTKWHFSDGKTSISGRVGFTATYKETCSSEVTHLG